MSLNIFSNIDFVYKLAGTGIATALLNTILVRMGKKEIADSIDLIVIFSAFGYVIYIITNSIVAVKDVISLF